MKIIDGITVWHLIGVLAGYFLHDKIYDLIKGSGEKKLTNPQ
jgi:hypothetical protein